MSESPATTQASPEAVQEAVLEALRIYTTATTNGDQSDTGLRGRRARAADHMAETLRKLGLTDIKNTEFLAGCKYLRSVTILSVDSDRKGAMIELRTERGILRVDLRVGYQDDQIVPSYGSHFQQLPASEPMDERESEWYGDRIEDEVYRILTGIAEREGWGR